MVNIEQVVNAFGATRGTLVQQGQASEASGAGGGLVSAVDQQGVSSLISALGIGDTLDLEDAGVRLSLVHEGAEVRVRAAWTDGPTYEDRIPVPGGTTAAPVEPVAARSAPAAAVQMSSQPLFEPDLGSKVDDLVAALHAIDTPLYVSKSGVYTAGSFGSGEALSAVIPALGWKDLGSPSFRKEHGVQASYVAGAMAGGIASADLVIAMGEAGLIGFFGAGGLPLPVVEKEVVRIKSTLGDRPAGFNLLHNPLEPKVEMGTVEMYLQHDCRFLSASAFMTLTPAIVRYRLHGIHRNADGDIVCPNHVFAKVSRSEVAEPFMRPAPKALVEQCVAEGWITQDQANLAGLVPMAEDITAEGDSGGHTDRRPLVVLLPTLQRLRDKVMREECYAERGVQLRVGAAGGIGDPASAYGALAMGADYLLTGSINQASQEAGTSDLAKQMIAAAGMADVATGPAPDMFEIGAHVQVLSRGSMYAQRAGRLYDLYKRYGSMEEVPTKDREKVEKTIFKRTFDDVWDGTRQYWSERDPSEVERAEKDGRHKMALTFRWYLGMTSRWARMGEKDRKRDFQIWCGPSMGAFNDWVGGTWLEPLQARSVVAIAHAMLHGAAALRRVEAARAAGVMVPTMADHPTPKEL